MTGAQRGLPKKLTYRQFCLVRDGCTSDEADSWWLDVDIDRKPKRSSQKGRVPARLFVASVAFDDDNQISSASLYGENHFVEDSKVPRLPRPASLKGSSVPTRRNKLAKLLKTWEVIDEDEMWCMVEDEPKKVSGRRRSYADVATNEMGIGAFEDPHMVETAGRGIIPSRDVMKKPECDEVDELEEFDDVKGISEDKFGRSLRGRVEASRRHHERAARKKERKMRKSGK